MGEKEQSIESKPWANSSMPNH